MNSELCQKALGKVVNPNVLVNLVSRRVRQLTGGGQGSRPLMNEVAGMGAADVALLELIDGKMEWEQSDLLNGPPPSSSGSSKRKKSS